MSRYILAETAPALHRQLVELTGQRCVFFAGLPSTGKSLLVHQLAHLAVSSGRGVHLLQWDVARPVFEASLDGRRYPMVDGITHVLIRRAVGLWARDRLATWETVHPDATNILIGEAPLTGGRFIELVSPQDDAAEALLTSRHCSFVLPVPSEAVRSHIESERRRRFLEPVNPRELGDAPPDVLQESWRELLLAAQQAGVLAAASETTAYDSDVYRRAYSHLLRHRRLELIPVEVVLPTAEISVYDYGIDCTPLLPAPDEIERWIRAAEAEAGLS